jgi:hypothetical protein
MVSAALRWMRIFAVSVLSVLLACAAGWSGYLMWRLLHKAAFEIEYTGWGELLLVFVIAVEGLIAIFELTHSERSTKAAANRAVFDQYNMYLSIKYQQEVRRPAWQALLLARNDTKYRVKLLQGLAGELTGDEATGYLESERRGETPTAQQKYEFALHNDYHRVQDIFGFFATLALLKADHDVLQVCNFFYDRWRIPLHEIVHYLGQYRPSNAFGDTLLKLKERRHGAYLNTLKELDKRFSMGEFEWHADPYLQNRDAQ